MRARLDSTGRMLSCTRKEGLSYERAKRLAARIRRQSDDVVVEYYCHECGRWHVGQDIEHSMAKASRRMWKPGRKRN